MTTLYVIKNPSAGTIAKVMEHPVDGAEEMTEADFIAWRDAQIVVEPVKPRTIWPYEFQSLLTDDQLVAIQTSTSPPLIRMRTKVQTLVSPMPFDESSELYQGVQLLGMVLPKVFPPDEVTRILAG